MSISVIAIISAHSLLAIEENYILPNIYWLREYNFIMIMDVLPVAAGILVGSIIITTITLLIGSIVMFMEKNIPIAKNMLMAAILLPIAVFLFPHLGLMWWGISIGMAILVTLLLMLQREI